MASKTYQCNCPLSKKPVSVRVDFEKIEVCGDTGTQYLRGGTLVALVRLEIAQGHLKKILNARFTKNLFTNLSMAA